MSKAKFAAAKDLIAQKKYTEARRLLKSIDHPTAREWEAKLNQLDQFDIPTDAQIRAPKKKSKPTPKTGNRRIYNGVRGCLVILVVLIGISIFSTPSKNPTSSDTVANPTATSRPDVRPTATEGQAIADVPTVVNRSGFVTVTPVPGTVYPTATITDTPVPSATATDAPTSTALPTETPALQITPVSNNLYDVISTANARSCPDSKCDLIGQFQAGNIISVLGIVIGEDYKSSPLWIQAIYHDGQTVFVHSSLVTPHVDYVQPVSPITQPISVIPPSSSRVSCGGATTCDQMASCEQAYACLREGNKRLDGEGDGVPCENICPGG